MVNFEVVKLSVQNSARLTLLEIFKRAGVWLSVIDGMVDFCPEEMVGLDDLQSPFQFTRSMINSMNFIAKQWNLDSSGFALIDYLLALLCIFYMHNTMYYLHWML